MSAFTLLAAALVLQVPIADPGPIPAKNLTYTFSRPSPVSPDTLTSGSGVLVWNGDKAWVGQPTADGWYLEVHGSGLVGSPPHPATLVAQIVYPDPDSGCVYTLMLAVDAAGAPVVKSGGLVVGSVTYTQSPFDLTYTFSASPGFLGFDKIELTAP
jgi:hypothetical protein